MRFRYFDSEGTEVGLSSVDALRFRIRKGVITPETLLYDAAAGQWAMARQNPLFRFLVEEEDDLLPPEMRPLMDEGASLPDAGDPETDRSARPWRAGGSGVEFTDLDASLDVELPEGDGTGRDSGGIGAGSLSKSRADAAPDGGFAGDGGSAGDAGGSGEGRGAHQGKEEEGATEDGFPDIELRISESEWARGSAEEIDPRPEGFRGGRKRGGGRAPASGGAGEGDRRRVFPSGSSSSRSAAGVGAGRRSRWTAPRRVSKKGDLSRTGAAPRRRSRPSLVALALVSGVVALVAGIPLILLGPRGSEARGSAYALVGTVTDGLLGGGSEDDAPDEDSGEAEGGARSPEGEEVGAGTSVAAEAPPALPSPERMETLADRVETAAAKDIARSMAELRGSMGVPESPPSIWLQGRYLAAADSFPEVAAYWRAISSYVSSLEDREDGLYLGYVRRRSGQAGLDSIGTARLVDHVLERRRGSAADREAVYRDLSELAHQALTLHETLAARSEDISYEPFDGTGLSRDPVIEAVAEDPALGEAIWGRIDRIMELLESLQGLRPVSTSQLQAALLRTGALREVEGAAEGASTPD